MLRITPTVLHILIINVILFLYQSVIGERVIFDILGLHYPQNPKFEIWQVFTHMFMHGGFTHLLFNMIVLWMFASSLEGIWGRNKFLFFYFSAGLGAAAMQLLYYQFRIDKVYRMLSQIGLTNSEINNVLTSRSLPEYLFDQINIATLEEGIQAFDTVMVGASGALYGVLVAFAIMFPNVRLMLLFPPIPVKAKYLVPILISFDLFLGFSSYEIGRIAHFAHLGGAVTGFLMMLYWNRK